LGIQAALQDQEEADQVAGDRLDRLPRGLARVLDGIGIHRKPMDGRVSILAILLSQHVAIDGPTTRRGADVGVGGAIGIGE
jgi:hypothetical protein